MLLGLSVDDFVWAYFGMTLGFLFASLTVIARVETEFPVPSYGRVIVRLVYIAMNLMALGYIGKAEAFLPDAHGRPLTFVLYATTTIVLVLQALYGITRRSKSKPWIANLFDWVRMIHMVGTLVALAIQAFT